MRMERRLRQCGKSKVSIRNRPFCFDGNKAHFVEPFSGERYSVVLYTIGKHELAKKDVEDEVLSLGFSPVCIEDLQHSH